MNQNEQAKLLNAGFTIVQGHDGFLHGELCIIQKTKARHSWHVKERGFASKASLKRRLTELMKDERMIDLLDSKNHDYKSFKA